MELVILKAKSQLNRVLSGERERQVARGGGGGGAGRGGAGARGAGPPVMPAVAPAPAPARPTPAPWLNATIVYNLTRLNTTFDIADYDILNANSTDEHNHWFCAKWSNAQQDLFQVTTQSLFD